jgi:hypothetical protein
LNPGHLAYLKKQAAILGLHDIPPGTEEYISGAASFFVAESQRLAKMMPDGKVGTAPNLLLQNAALSLIHAKLAHSEGRIDAAIRYQRDCKENLLEAHKLAKMESEARIAVNRDEGPEDFPELTQEEYAQLVAAANAK